MPLMMLWKRFFLSPPLSEAPILGRWCHRTSSRACAWENKVDAANRDNTFGAWRLDNVTESPMSPLDATPDDVDVRMLMLGWFSQGARPGVTRRRL